MTKDVKKALKELAKAITRNYDASAMAHKARINIDTAAYALEVAIHNAEQEDKD